MGLVDAAAFMAPWIMGSGLALLWLSRRLPEQAALRFSAVTACLLGLPILLWRLFAFDEDEAIFQRNLESFEISQSAAPLRLQRELKTLGKTAALVAHSAFHESKGRLITQDSPALMQIRIDNNKYLNYEELPQLFDQQKPGSCLVLVNVLQRDLPDDETLQEIARTRPDELTVWVVESDESIARKLLDSGLAHAVFLTRCQRDQDSFLAVCQRLLPHGKSD
ncbi:MAG: hypothetical protein RL095_3506 [Verrucomicrobiota bacterium]|jgi:hypothetical protein